jgi:very-short-patch-repair endonuclease
MACIPVARCVLSPGPAPKSRTHELRHTPTDTEQAAYCSLRNIKFKGFKFRRQNPLGPHIVDFYCAQRRLVVELDGSVHGQPGQARKDAHRDAHLKKMGYMVLRFSKSIVREVAELIVQEIQDAA